MKSKATAIQLPIWIDALWLLLLSLYMLGGAAIVPFHGDESTQIAMSRDALTLFSPGGLSRIVYEPGRSTPTVEEHLRLVNGTVAKSLYGGLAALNGFSSESLNQPWDWQADYQYNRDNHARPDQNLLRQARLASAAQLALAMIALYGLARLCINRNTALLASALFALHPTLLLNGRRAMMEGSHLLGMMLVLLISAWLLRERRSKWRVLLLSLGAGFAIAAKHPNAFVVALVFLACGSWRLIESFRAREPLGSMFKAQSNLLAAIPITLLVFLLLNPAWWRAPLAAAAEVLSQRVSLLEEQVARYGGYETVGERVSGFYEHLFLTPHQSYEAAAWARYPGVAAEIAAYQASGWAGIGAGGNRLAGWLSLALTIGGAFCLARDARVQASLRWLLLVWAGGMALITLILTPLPWARYYLPALPIVALMTGYALARLSQLLWRRIDARGYAIDELD